ncbi:hypothetical protein [Nocardioides alkalitolerans]|uniref:hypothetical protein n=1 Tax=Nocardioides alkalitolerans TaxID=281714 RepID=UPI0003F77A7B|nr:hypothetical protein [Nocardioides alkalitolerans]
MRTMRRGARRTVAIAAGAVLATSMLAACGSDDNGDDAADGESSSTEETEGGSALDDMSAEEIYDAALEATSGSSSVRLVGSIDGDGQAIEMDIALGTDSCDGSMTISGLTIDLLGVDGEYWFRGDDAFWASQSDGTPEDQALLDLVSGMWVPDTEGEFSEFCNIDSFFGDQDDEDRPTDFAKGDTTEVDGQAAQEISWTTSEGDDVTAAVATEEPYYYLQLEQGDNGTIAFSEFDEDLDVEAPPADEVLDPSQLG